MGAGRTVRVNGCCLCPTGGFSLIFRDNRMCVGDRRVVTEMLGKEFRFMPTVVGDHTPAQLDSENRYDKVDEASCGHGKSVA